MSNKPIPKPCASIAGGEESKKSGWKTIKDVTDALVALNYQKGRDRPLKDIHMALRILRKIRIALRTPRFRDRLRAVATLIEMLGRKVEVEAEVKKTGEGLERGMATMGEQVKAIGECVREAVDEMRKEFTVAMEQMKGEIRGLKQAGGNSYTNIARSSPAGFPLSKRELVEKANLALESIIRATEKPMPMLFIIVHKLKDGDVLMLMNTKEVCHWLCDGRLMDFLSGFNANSWVQAPMLMVVAKFVPVDFDPDTMGELQANKAIQDRLVIHGEMITDCPNSEMRWCHACKRGGHGAGNKTCDTRLKALGVLQKANLEAGQQYFVERDKPETWGQAVNNEEGRKEGNLGCWDNRGTQSMSGKQGVTQKFHIIYLFIEEARQKEARAVILLSTEIASDQYITLQIESPDVVGVDIKCGPVGLIRVMNVYNDCKHNHSLNTMDTFLMNEQQHGNEAIQNQMIWVGAFNQHHLAWDEEFSMVMKLEKGLPTLLAHNMGNYTCIDNVWCSEAIQGMFVSCKGEGGAVACVPSERVPWPRERGLPVTQATGRVTCLGDGQGLSQCFTQCFPECLPMLTLFLSGVYAGSETTGKWSVFVVCMISIWYQVSQLGGQLPNLVSQEFLLKTAAKLRCLCPQVANSGSRNNVPKSLCYLLEPVLLKSSQAPAPTSLLLSHFLSLMPCLNLVSAYSCPAVKPYQSAKLWVNTSLKNRTGHFKSMGTHSKCKALLSAPPPPHSKVIYSPKVTRSMTSHKTSRVNPPHFSDVKGKGKAVNAVNSLGSSPYIVPLPHETVDLSYDLANPTSRMTKGQPAASSPLADMPIPLISSTPSLFLLVHDQSSSPSFLLGVELENLFIGVAQALDIYVEPLQASVTQWHTVPKLGGADDLLNMFGGIAGRLPDQDKETSLLLRNVLLRWWYPHCLSHWDSLAQQLLNLCMKELIIEAMDLKKMGSGLEAVFTV
ncbi:hypothetical protein BDN71DRAFT_1429538 [Pleurotus eryngii]|uniref:Uncharacterized protein n=1 Tax=Pleurotus eryngii TaxID=5323 RepID=A0A9P6A3X8_PLEER|nr:hypothetical protein BDN71DRAFT_1429538 [Pleurotus eryngii]